LKDIYIRTLTGIFFVVAIFGSVLLHPLAFFGVTLFFVFISLNEFLLLQKIKGGQKENFIYYFFGLLIYILVGLMGLGFVDVSFALFLLLLFPFTFVVELFRKEHSTKRIGSYFTAWLYISVPFGLLVSLYNIPQREGFFPGIIIGLFTIIWSSDVFAYLVGSMIGKTKLFERISPKKSWEGSIGGLVFALLAAYILSLIYTDFTLIQWMGMAVIVVLTGSIGDLVESMLKRIAGVKDTGTLLPGHGGVLDRFDATIFATPFVFVYINLI
jgi:phosphatidate cytidylyltransferase